VREEDVRVTDCSVGYCCYWRDIYSSGNDGGDDDVFLYKKE